MIFLRSFLASNSSPRQARGRNPLSRWIHVISLDSSIIAAILVFLGLIIALNYLLFRPLQKVLTERESRTTGVVGQAQQSIDHFTDLSNRYQATIKQARLEGYRRQEEVRAEAGKKRAEEIDRARKSAEQLIQEARTTIQTQVEKAKEQLDREAREISSGIAATVLQRSA